MPPILAHAADNPARRALLRGPAPRPPRAGGVPVRSGRSPAAVPPGGAGETPREEKASSGPPPRAATATSDADPRPRRPHLVAQFRADDGRLQHVRR
ncbi:hypothetical protein ABT329_13035, partial [Streptomyces minutiscleroticus]